jgi:hypothetical protein
MGSGQKLCSDEILISPASTASKIPGQQAHPDAVAQFGVGKAQPLDFAQHGASISMAVGIPAGGK